jgi:anaerobic selenocysteine-containing dehydrogenase
MATKRVIKTACVVCQAGCGLLVHIENGEIVQITGDPESPVNRGKLCVKGEASLGRVHHPARLKYPLRRTGERGSGRWERISWNEALDKVADQLLQAKTAHGPESVVFMRGSFKGGYGGAYLARFANAFGAPNIASMASVCFQPRVNGSVFTHGFNPVPDYDYPPASLLVWGANLPETRLGEGVDTLKALQKGSKLIVVDPRKFDLSRRAEIWLQLRPGSDLALALGLIHVIIAETLYDRSFVDSWTIGFNELKKHVEQYPPEGVEKITWVPASLIKDAARLYATSKPAVLQAGNAIDHNGNNFQTARALAILRAITGNLGVPGGELACSQPPIVPMGSPEFDLRNKLQNGERNKRLNAADGMLPSVFYTLPQSIVKAVLKGEPYKMHAAYILGGNMLLTYTNAQEVYKALRQIDFLAVADMFMTPTVAMADIVFPVGSYLETDGIIAPPYYPVVQVQQKAVQFSECRSDYEILAGLARRVGISEYFWESEKECLDYILKPAGLTFEEFGHIGALVGKKEYRKHEKDGFSTPSKKVELYSERLQDWGFDPLPTYREISETPLSAPELARKYPLVLMSWKTEEFRHSGERQIESLRKLHPEPIVRIHPDTAAELGIVEGDAVYIETKRGRIQQKAVLTADIDRRVAGVDYGWWFPEKSPEGMYGWAEANVNILTDDAPPWGREMGTPNLRSFLCKVYKAQVRRLR